MSIWTALAEWDVAQAFRDWESGFPMMESLHLIGLAMFFGAIVLLDLRVLGVMKALSVDGMKRLCLPLTWSGFTLLTTSGTILFVAAADQYMRTWSFPIKLALIAGGGVNAWLFHSRPADGRTARFSALLSMTIWIAAIVAGRWAGYERQPL